jgi:ABC-type glycerol-3-phosphate transport system permease component
MIEADIHLAKRPNLFRQTKPALTAMAITSLYRLRTGIGLVMAMTLLSLIPGLAVISYARNPIAMGIQSGPETVQDCRS